MSNNKKVPVDALFFGTMGCAAAIVFSCKEGQAHGKERGG
jgi:hypothetical protein